MRSLIIPARTITQSTPRTRIIVGDLGTQTFEFRAGQAVTVGLAEGTVRRPYSIACSPNQASRTRAVELLVQIDDHAAPDPHLERAAPGTLLRIDGPFGSFSLPSALLERRILLIAGGTGIAPLRSICGTFSNATPASPSASPTARARPRSSPISRNSVVSRQRAGLICLSP